MSTAKLEAIEAIKAFNAEMETLRAFETKLKAWRADPEAFCVELAAYEAERAAYTAKAEAWLADPEVREAIHATYAEMEQAEKAAKQAKQEAKLASAWKELQLMLSRWELTEDHFVDPTVKAKTLTQLYTAMVRYFRALEGYKFRSNAFVPPPYQHASLRKRRANFMERLAFWKIAEASPSDPLDKAQHLYQAIMALASFEFEYCAQAEQKQKESVMLSLLGTSRYETRGKAILRVVELQERRAARAARKAVAREGDG